ncbi:unnamed protein product [Chrysoparadoxa australica]
MACRPVVLAIAGVTTAAALVSLVWDRGEAKENGAIQENEAHPTTPEAIISFWFGQDSSHYPELFRTRWFPSGVAVDRADAEVSKQFGEALTWARGGKLHESWCSSPAGLLALILLLDQFPRHVYRNRHDRDEQVQACDEMALALCEKLLERGWEKGFDTARHVFALMPLRHTPTEERLKRVLDQVEVRETLLHHEKDLLGKFKKATTRRLQGLQDIAPEGEDILEHHSFAADESALGRHRLVRTVTEFLKRHSASARAVAISLSGGVDSMVLAKICRWYQDRPGCPYDQVVAVHIDYGNRRESGDEAAYVENWCRQLGITCHTRAISEVRRGQTDRDEYERIAREIRYGTYRGVMDTYRCAGIMVGHHKGDVQENVLSNAMKGCSPLGLSGMTSVGIVNGVSVWRPMLPFGKEVVLEVAHRYGVPYFKDTTPSWSTRGKLRNHLLPLLQDMYGVGMLSSLSRLAEESDELKGMVHGQLLGPVWESATRTAVGAYLDIMPYRGQGPFFWREVMRELMHSLGQPMARGPAIEELRRHFGKDGGPIPKDGRIELRKEYFSFLESGVLCVLRAFVTPSAALIETFRRIKVPVGADAPTSAGPWLINANVEKQLGLKEAKECWGRGHLALPCILAPPFASVKEFMHGEFSYYIAVAVTGETPEMQLQLHMGGKGIKAWAQVEHTLRSKIAVAVPSEENQELLSKWMGSRGEIVQETSSSSVGIVKVTYCCIEDG